MAQQPLRFIRLTSERSDDGWLDTECVDDEEREYIENYLRLADMALHDTEHPRVT